MNKMYIEYGWYDFFISKFIGLLGIKDFLKLFVFLLLGIRVKIKIGWLFKFFKIIINS